MNFPPEKQSERLASAIESLKNKGYAFNNDKRMVQISVDGVVDDSKGFEFVVRKEDRAFNQKNYEQIGDILTEYVYGVLESDPINFVRREFPEDQEEKSFIYESADSNDKETLLVLIHGSGVVRAGQWTRKLMMNENMDLGTILPEVFEAKKRDFGILVMNTNDNVRIDSKTSKEKRINGCENAIKSGVSTWEKFVEKSNHKNIVIIGHSFGGAVTMHLANQFSEDFENRVRCILLTDSAHGYANTPECIRKVCINFEASDEPLDTDLGEFNGMITKSAGHTVHEWTPSTSRPCLFNYIDKFLSKE